MEKGGKDDDDDMLKQRIQNSKEDNAFNLQKTNKDEMVTVDDNEEPPINPADKVGIKIEVDERDQKTASRSDYNVISVPLKSTVETDVQNNYFNKHKNKDIKKSPAVLTVAKKEAAVDDELSKRETAMNRTDNVITTSPNKSIRNSKTEDDVQRDTERNKGDNTEPFDPAKVAVVRKQTIDDNKSELGQKMTTKLDETSLHETNVQRYIIDERNNQDVDNKEPASDPVAVGEAVQKNKADLETSELGRAKKPDESTSTPSKHSRTAMQRNTDEDDKEPSQLSSAVQVASEIDRTTTRLSDETSSSIHKRIDVQTNANQRNQDSKDPSTCPAVAIKKENFDTVETLSRTAGRLSDETSSSPLYKTYSRTTDVPRHIDAYMTFPERLMEMLNTESEGGIISWLPHGNAFMVYKKDQFEKEILYKYFERQSKFASFTRKMNRWGFARVTKGPEAGAFYHPQFKRDEPELCKQMSCKSSPSNQINKATTARSVAGAPYVPTATTSNYHHRTQIPQAQERQQYQYPPYSHYYDPGSWYNNPNTPPASYHHPYNPHEMDPYGMDPTRYPPPPPYASSMYYNHPSSYRQHYPEADPYYQRHHHGHGDETMMPYQYPSTEPTQSHPTTGPHSYDTNSHDYHHHYHYPRPPPHYGVEDRTRSTLHDDHQQSFARQTTQHHYPPPQDTTTDEYKDEQYRLSGPSAAAWMNREDEDDDESYHHSRSNIFRQR